MVNDFANEGFRQEYLAALLAGAPLLDAHLLKQKRRNGKASDAVQPPRPEQIAELQRLVADLSPPEIAAVQTLANTLRHASQ